MPNATRLCDEDGCERTHLARGMCGYHYRIRSKEQGTFKRTTYPCVCDVCGQGFRGLRRTARFCNDRCKGDAYRIENRTHSRELVHVGPAWPITWLPAQHPVIAGVTKYKQRTWYCGACAWCGDTYTNWWPQGRYCTRRCMKQAQRAKSGRFAIPDRVRMTIYNRDNWICQLCLESVDQDLMSVDPQNDWAPSLDHVICQSWTSEPDHSENNLRLAHRWCNAVRNDGRRYTEDDLRVA